MSWKKVGKVKEAHGLKGELWAIIFDKSWDALEELEEFGLGPGETEPTQVFPLSAARFQSKGLILRSPLLTDRNQAEALLNQYFFVPEDLAPEALNEDPELVKLFGYAVWDHERLVGQVTGFTDHGAQILMHVENSQHEIVDIPFVEAFLIDIADDEKVIRMDLPEGLIEVNQKEPKT